MPSWWKTAVSHPGLATESEKAKLKAMRFREYPVKLETETIGYVKGQFRTTTTTSRTFYGAAKIRSGSTSLKYFKISSKGQVKSGYYTDPLNENLPILDLDNLTEERIKEFTQKTGLTELADIRSRYEEIQRYENGNIPELYITYRGAATTTLADGKTHSKAEYTKIRGAIVAAALNEQATATKAAAPAAPVQVDPNVTALAEKYGGSQITNANVIDVLTKLIALAASPQADGHQLAEQDITDIVAKIEQKRDAANSPAAAAASGVGAAAPDLDKAALADKYGGSQITSANVIDVLTAVNELKSQASQASIENIVNAAKAEMPLLINFKKIIAFLKSGPITEKICSDTNFDDKTVVALLFMVYTDRLDVHFIKKRLTLPFRKTTVIVDTHYISSDSKDILTIPYTDLIDVNEIAMLEILNLICLPVSFRIVKVVNNKQMGKPKYGFRNRHTEAATRQYAVEKNDERVVYPFTSDTSEIDLILYRADDKNKAVEASAKFTNAPTIAKLTDLQELLCVRDPKILTDDGCAAIKKNIETLGGQAGGRRSRKRMNKNKRASSRQSRRHRHRHVHGHNSRKRYSAGSKSKSGLNSKSSSKRRRNQTQQQQ